MTNETPEGPPPVANNSSSDASNRPISWREFLAANRTAVILALIALFALLGACLLGAIILGTLLIDRIRGAEPTPTPLSTTVPLPLPDGLVIGTDGSSTITVTLNVPVTLEVRGRTFAIQPQVIAGDGVWSPSVEGETAVWVYGTIINYVMGVEGTEENRTFLDGLAPGDSLIMTTQDGTRFTFTFSSRTSVAANNRDIYAQRTPGITLVLLGADGQDRLVVNGRYVVEETNPNLQNNVVELGEAAQLEDMQLTVTSVSYVPDRPEIPPGFAFYLIDFQIQNLGLTALDNNRLQLILSDTAGNQYVLNPAASQVGNFPPLSGFLNSNQTAQASAGYQIPATLNSPTLSWIITRTDTGGSLRVTIPFNGGAQAASGSVITLTRADVTADFTGLVLGGQITNASNQPLVIVESDLSLRTSDGAAYLLLTTNPPFPWTVPPGQIMEFVVTYQRPLTAESATFTVLNQGFLLSGLR